MYTPELFKITDEKTIEEFIANNPFAILTSQNSGKIEVTHLPIYRFKDGELYGHLARANVHATIDETQEVCFIFSGEHAYISPTYYASKFNVPTWNYSTVHVYGNVAYIDEREKVWALLEEVTQINEGKDGWKLPQEEKFKGMTKFLRFFKINVTYIEAQFKFNQNKSKDDIEKVIKSLRANKQIEVANFMEKITISH